MMTIPAYIGGFRSGTTLLVNLVGQHPALVPWFETKELCEVLRWLKVLAEPAETAFETAYCVPADPTGFSLEAVYSRMLWNIRDTVARLNGKQASGKASHERYPIGHDYLDYAPERAEELLRHWYQACQSNSDLPGVQHASAALIEGLGKAQCERHNSKNWINKTPEITRFAPQLRALHGRARIIYMVRNGLEVVSSASSLGWGNGRDLAYNWQGLLQRTRDAMQAHPEDYLELRYEHLLENPAAVLDRVFAFLDVAPCGEKIVEDFHTRYGASAFDAGRATTRVLSEEILQQFCEVAGEMQRALGYPLPVI